MCSRLSAKRRLFGQGPCPMRSVRVSAAAARAVPRFAVRSPGSSTPRHKSTRRTPSPALWSATFAVLSVRSPQVCRTADALLAFCPALTAPFLRLTRLGLRSGDGVWVRQLPLHRPSDTRFPCETHLNVAEAKSARFSQRRRFPRHSLRKQSSSPKDHDPTSPTSPTLITNIAPAHVDGPKVSNAPPTPPSCT